MVNRRQFVQAASALAVPGVLGSAMAQERQFNPQPGAWREFEFTTRIEVTATKGTTRVWLPVPSINTDYQQSLDNSWSGNATKAELVTDAKYGARMLVAEFAANTDKPVLELSSRIRTQNRSTDFAQKISAKENPLALKAWMQPTELMPIDGIVLQTAKEITKGARTDVDKVRAIYDWVIANTYREPKVRGCGTGDIKAMLETGNMGGKCADINALFVGLCRAVGLPARDVYGIRLAPSAFGYKELSGQSAQLKGAQHCRAEVHLAGSGWVAVDPADVAKVMRLETPTWIKRLDHPVVEPVYRHLFGGWEGNWLGWNFAHDLQLPASEEGQLHFLMYPVAETEEGRVDSYAPDAFRYTISAQELSA